MQIIHTIAELRAALKAQTNIGFVPTMGNLHQGHVDLVKIARQHAQIVVVSIFVNPLQFGANEDFGKYPRTLQADCEKLTGLANIVFAPSVDEMYPQMTEHVSEGINLNQTMTITPPPLADTLCGASRPGHFSGVATVVLKLFNMVAPQIAVFGKKDFQQLLVIKTLEQQFNLPIQIIAAETTREPDGLAMSSRNGYLSTAERAQAVQLNQQLNALKTAILAGERDYAALEKTAENTLAQNGWVVDYVAIRHAQDLSLANVQTQNLVVLAAAKIGKTRLIDNVEFTLSQV